MPRLLSRPAILGSNIVSVPSFARCAIAVSVAAARLAAACGCNSSPVFTARLVDFLFSST